MKRPANLSSICFRRWLLWGCLTGCSSLPLLAHADDSDDSGQTGLNRYFGLQPKSSDDDYDWSRHFRIGAMVGLNIHGNFNESGLFTTPGNNGLNGIFNDGYVLEDNTGNAGGITGNWGYNNASQYNAVADTLTYHGTSGYEVMGSDRDDAGPSAGFDMVYGANLFTFHKVRIGVELGFGLLPLSITDHQTLSGTVNGDTYTYDTGGISLPVAPYQGTANSTGGAPLSAEPSTITPYSTPGTVTGSRRLDAILYSIRVGPSFYWDFNRYLGMSVGGGGAVGIVPGEYKYDETITTSAGSSQNTGSFSKTDIVFGGDVNATLLFHTEDAYRPVDIYLGVSYMPMGSADFSSGGRDAHLNLQGQVYISAGVNWPF
jgi:hypothetical protein